MVDPSSARDRPTDRPSRGLRAPTGGAPGTPDSALAIQLTAGQSEDCHRLVAVRPRLCRTTTTFAGNNSRACGRAEQRPSRPAGSLLARWRPFARALKAGRFGHRCHRLCADRSIWARRNGASHPAAVVRPRTSAAAWPPIRQRPTEPKHLDRTSPPLVTRGTRNASCKLADQHRPVQVQENDKKRRLLGPSVTSHPLSSACAGVVLAHRTAAATFEFGWMGATRQANADSPAHLAAVSVSVTAAQRSAPPWR